MDKKKLLSSCHLNNVQLLKKLSQLAWSPEEQWNKKNNSQRWWRGLWWSVHVTLCVGLKCLQYANKKAKTISALRGTACPTVWGWYLIMNSSMGCLTSLRQWKELYKSSLLQVLLSTSLTLLASVIWVSQISFKLQRLTCHKLLVQTQNQVLFRTARLWVICDWLFMRIMFFVCLFFPPIYMGALMKPGSRKGLWGYFKQLWFPGF